MACAPCDRAPLCDDYARLKARDHTAKISAPGTGAEDELRRSKRSVMPHPAGAAPQKHLTAGQIKSAGSTLSHRARSLPPTTAWSARCSNLSIPSNNRRQVGRLLSGWRRAPSFQRVVEIDYQGNQKAAIPKPVQNADRTGLDVAGAIMPDSNLEHWFRQRGFGDRKGTSPGPHFCHCGVATQSSWWARWRKPRKPALVPAGSVVQDP